MKYWRRLVLMRTRLSSAGAILVLALAPILSPAESMADYCNGTNGGDPRAMDKMASAKKSVNDGNYATGKQLAIAVQKAADQCIAAHQDQHEYAYVHAFGVIVEAQARLGLDEIANGTALMRQGMREAEAVVDDPQADSAIRKLARDIVYGAQIELNRIRAAKPGEVLNVTPPPTAPPTAPP
jgi:hypothetical protein